MAMSISYKISLQPILHNIFFENSQKLQLHYQNAMEGRGNHIPPTPTPNHHPSPAYT